MKSWLWRLVGVFSKARRDRELTAELDAHIRAHIDDSLRAGMSHGEARRHAFLTLGGVDVSKDNYRDRRGLPWLEHLARDVRHALRLLRRSPAFTLATVLTLALAIGANASIFAVVHRILLNPLAYPASDRLIQLDFGRPNVSSGAISTMTSRLYFQYVDRARTVESLALYELSERTLTGQGDPERIGVARTTSSLADVMRTGAARGRWFTAAEAAPGASPVAVLSHGLWIRRFGSDPAILGQVITLDRVPTMVVGVMPPSYQFPDLRWELWTPMPLAPATASDDYCCYGIARLRDGATMAAARAELTSLTADLDTTFPGHRYREIVSTATPLIESHVGRIADTLWILFASVALVLLVACANVANLFLVRSEARQRETAVRRALGAGSGGIARYFLVESALLSIAGGAAGLTLAAGAIQLLVAYGPENLPRLEEVRVDGMVLSFTLILTLVTAVACGAIPMLRLAPLTVSLTESSRGNTASRHSHRARRFLMAGQVATALILLVGSGLMVRSFQKLRDVDPGFDPASALTFRIGLPRSEYADRGRAAAAHHAILDRLSRLPGVTAVSASTGLPLTAFGNGGLMFVEGQSVPAGSAPLVAVRAVAGGYVEAMGMRLLRGRSIDRNDVERNQPIVVVNQALANGAFPNQEPIGQRISFVNPSGAAPGAITWLTIAGVVSNTPTNALAEAARVPKVYMPMFGLDVAFGPRIETMSYVVRTASSPAGLTTAARAVIREVDPNLAVARVRTLQDFVDRASAQMAFTMVLIAIAAGVALMLGMIGIYGVMSYIVAQRTTEIGVRLALGAEPGSVAGMIVRQGGLVALVGIAAGLATALAGSRLIESLLYGVSSRDPVVFAAATVTLLSVALLACWLPARRAASVDPLVALRAE